MFLAPSCIEETTQASSPLASDYMVRKVLIPEAALGLIAQDFNMTISDPHIMDTLQESRAFGEAMFHDNDD